MQKDKFIELIRTGVFGGNSTVDRLYQADPRRIELDITSALNTIFFKIFKKDPSNLDRYSKQYLSVPILYESSTQTYYSILPAQVIQFPVVGDGIWNINTMTGRDVTFNPVQMGNKEFIFDSEWKTIDDVIGYSLSGNKLTDAPPLNGRVTYFNFDPMITAVKMDLVVAFTEWGMSEDVPIPSGQDLEVLNIVRQMYGLVPIDKLNNQNEVA
jgi:hypothetical protein